MSRAPNLLLLGIDSLRADHMSLYGYHRLTTPRLDKLAARGSVFENAFSPHIPTTPGYSSLFTGRDCFGTNVVALRHRGGLGDHLATLAEVLGANGYNTTCVGLSANPASRGFERYLEFAGWGSWEEGRSHKAENLNALAIPELRRLAGEDRPFFLFLRYLDPHSPYLPPQPFERLFYHGNEFDPANTSLEPVLSFKPFRDFFASWFPPGCRDKDYIIAQYDGAVAYMDACIAVLLETVRSLGVEDNTLIVVTADHGESLYDHDCYFDHHGLYDCTIRIPLAFVLAGKVPERRRFPDYLQNWDIAPTILDLLQVRSDVDFDGRSLAPLMRGRPRRTQCECYLTEATWMRKHGWRTPEWKLIRALEPDFHFKPEVELYNLVLDPAESINLAAQEPEITATLEARMAAHIAKRERQTGRTAPIFTNLDWHGREGPFKTSQEAYDALYIGSPATTDALQVAELRAQRGAREL